VTAKFGKQSRAVLDTVDPRLVECCELVIEVIDISALSGFRDKAEQETLVRQGLSKTHWPNSKHNKNAEGQLHPGAMAIDIAPFPIDWDDGERFIYMAGMFMMVAKMLGHKIRWGGDWDQDTEIKDTTFRDLGHFELILDGDDG